MSAGEYLYGLGRRPDPGLPGSARPLGGHYAMRIVGR
jgi:hypothetical protein